jgi:hypothetical protein
MARRIGDASSEPEVHAEPEEQAIPSMSRFKRSASPSTYRKERFTVFGSRSVGCPFRTSSGIREKSAA